MKRLLAAVSLLAALGGPWWASSAAMDALTKSDAREIHDVVQSQLEALANDDAAGAFELASNEKRTLIGSPDRFLQMIKEQYNPIYRYQRVLFSPPQVIDGDTIQIVRVTDGYSKVWIALFWMRQEEEGNWRVDGCQLLATSSVSV